jgi:LPS-assembly lipoprotein
MSSSEPLRATRRVVMAMFAPLALAGCFQPLYGTLGPGGMQSELQAIRVEPIADRTGHFLADELIFAFNGTGTPVPPRYRLTVSLKERVSTPLSDTVTYRVTSATVITDAEFALTPIDGGKVLVKGVAFGATSYDRFSQRVSNVAGARTAQVRDAKALAESIREQVSAYFASHGP